MLNLGTHHAFSRQSIGSIAMFEVPFVTDGDTFDLKTAFQSRKATKEQYKSTV